MENMEALQMKLPIAFPQQNHDAHIAAHSLFIKTRMVQINPSVYALLQGHISEHISQKASQEVVEALAQHPAEKLLAKQNPQMFTVKMNGMIAQRIVELTSQLQQAEAAGEQQVDPLVALKQRELDLRAAELQRKQQGDSINHSMETSKFKVDTLMRQHEIEVKDRQSNDRLEIAKDKIDLLRQKYDAYDQNKNVPK
jgi:sulfur relay (sulfurtransferase) DsrF/TusC family protein